MASEHLEDIMYTNLLAPVRKRFAIRENRGGSRQGKARKYHIDRSVMHYGYLEEFCT